MTAGGYDDAFAWHCHVCMVLTLNLCMGVTLCHALCHALCQACMYGRDTVTLHVSMYGRDTAMYVWRWCTNIVTFINVIEVIMRGSHAFKALCRRTHPDACAYTYRTYGMYGKAETVSDKLYVSGDHSTAQLRVGLILCR